MVAGVVLAASLAAPVAAANNTRIHVEIGLPFIVGSGSGANKVVKILWRDSDGNLKSKQSVTTDSNGFWEAQEFDEVIEPADTITTTR